MNSHGRTHTRWINPWGKSQEHNELFVLISKYYIDDDK